MTKLLFAFCALASIWGASAAVFDHSHDALTQVLKQHVRDGLVDYAALKSNRSALDAYLRDCAAVRETEFDQWTEPQQLAFLINLYNAETLQLVVDHYPVRSIKKIGGWLSSPWKQECVGLFGRTTTLDYIEHGMLRADYQEPRVHFALVCAAKSCPPLRAEAYAATRLNEQLEEQGRIFLRTRQSNRVEPLKNTVSLSPIFKWFAADFERKAPSVLKFVLPYFPPEDRDRLAGTAAWRVRYTEYDWSLNDIRRP